MYIDIKIDAPCTHLHMKQCQSPVVPRVGEHFEGYKIKRVEWDRDAYDKLTATIFLNTEE